MMRCTGCDRADAGAEVLDRTFFIDRRELNGPFAQLGPLRLCAGCWERRREAFRAEVDDDWRATLATIPDPVPVKRPRERRRLGGDRGMRL